MVELHPEFSRALLDALPGGIAFVDRHDYLQWVSGEFAALLGTDPRHLIGGPASSLPFPLRESAHQGEQFALVGEFLVVERTLTREPMVGRLLQIFARKPVQAALPAAARLLGPEMPVPTGLLTRAIGLQRLALEISRSRRYENPLSCLVGRANGVTETATLQGLTTLTSLLQEQLRWVDVLVQWAADRVLILLPESGAEATYRLQRKLAQAINACWPMEVTDVRVYWGSATWRRGDDAVRLVGRAEAASLAHSPRWSGAYSRPDP